MLVVLKNYVRIIFLASQVAADYVKRYSSRDNQSHILKHSMVKSHTEFETNDFKIIGRNFQNNIEKEKSLMHC